MFGIRYHALLLLLVAVVTYSLGWESESDHGQSDQLYLRRNGFSVQSTTENLGNGTTLYINYPIATVHIKAGGTYHQFGNTSLDYVFHINATSTVYIEGFRNSSMYYITPRWNTELRIANFNTWIDRFNFTNNPRIKKMTDIDVNTSTNTIFINKIVSRSTTSSIITLPKNQVIFLTKMEPTYEQLTDYNFILTFHPVEHNKKPPLSKAMTAVIIICSTVVFMAGYYTFNNRVALYRKLKTMIEYEDLLLYQIQVTQGEEPEIELPVLTDEKIDKKVVKYLKKAAKVAETTKQADGNVVAIFADKNGEIVDVVKNQQAFVSYQMSKFGRNTINMQKGEEAVIAVKNLVQENNTRAAEEILQVGSMKGRGGRKNRAAMKMFHTAPTDLSTVAPGVQEGVLQNIEEEEEEVAAPEDTSPQMTRARGNAMVKLNQPAEGATNNNFDAGGASTKKGPSSSFDSTKESPKSTNNGTYQGSGYSMKNNKVSPAAGSTSAKEMKPSEMKAKSSSSASSAASAAVVSPKLASTAAAAAAPLTNGLYYFPPSSSFASEPSPAATAATAPVSTFTATAPTPAVVTTPFSVTAAPVTIAPQSTSLDFNSGNLYAAAPVASSSFDLNTANGMGLMSQYAALTTTNFDMSGIDTSGFSTYAAGGFDATALSASYVPLAMDYTSSSYHASAATDNHYGSNLGGHTSDYTALHSGSYGVDHGTGYYDPYGGENQAGFGQYGDTSGYAGGAGVDYTANGQFDFNSYNANSNQYSSANGGYQQYGSYNSNTGY